ncbi:MAG: carbohydrate kinase [Lewinella sp.]|nr:carbohydrate kinase [Lewinella sp.]
MSQTDFFAQFNQLKILIIGDVMIDRYITGTVQRISPEAPVPVVNWQATDDRLGGAANVALNIAALGATPYLCSVIGEDENGQRFRELLPQAGIPNRYLHASTTRKTTVKTRLIAQSQHLLRVDREDQHDLNETETGQLLTMINELLDNRDIDLILFQDYNKGVLTPQLIREVMLAAIRRDVPTAVDPKYHNFWAYKHVTLFKPNLREIQQQLDFPIRPVLDDLNRAAEEIHRRLGNTYTLITLSEKGVFLHHDGEGRIYPTHPRSIADVCGAGDTVVSLAGAGLALGLDMQLVAQLANLAGGQVCEKVGVVPVDKAQLEREYRELVM